MDLFSLIEGWIKDNLETLKLRSVTYRKLASPIKIIANQISKVRF